MGSENLSIPSYFYPEIKGGNLANIKSRHQDGIKYLEKFIQDHKEFFEVLGVKIDGPNPDIAFSIHDRWYASPVESGITVNGRQGRDTEQSGKFWIQVDDEFFNDFNDNYIKDQKIKKLQKAFEKEFLVAAEVILLGREAKEGQPAVSGVIPQLISSNVEIPEDFLKRLGNSEGSVYFYKEIQNFRQNIISDKNKKISLEIIPDKREFNTYGDYTFHPDKDNLIITANPEGNLKIQISEGKLKQMGVVKDENWGFRTINLEPLRNALGRFLYEQHLSPDSNSPAVVEIATRPAEIRPDANQAVKAGELPPAVDKPAPDPNAAGTGKKINLKDF